MFKYQIHAKGLIIFIHVVAQAREEGLFVRSDNLLGIRVKAPALENKANVRVIELFSQWLHSAKKNIIILKGEHSKQKQVLITKLEPSYILEALKKIIS